MNIRERIKTLCKEKKVSLTKVETECGFAKGYLSKLDKSTPNISKMQLIADYFGVSMEYLLTGQENKEEKSAPHISARALKLISLIEELPDDSLKEIEKFVAYQQYTHQSDS